MSFLKSDSSNEELASKNLTFPNKQGKTMTELPNWWSIFTLIVTSVLSIIGAILNPQIIADIPEVMQTLQQLFLGGAGLMGLVRVIIDIVRRWAVTGPQSLASFNKDL